MKKSCRIGEGGCYTGFRCINTAPESQAVYWWHGHLIEIYDPFRPFEDVLAHTTIHVSAKRERACFVVLQEKFVEIKTYGALKVVEWSQSVGKCREQCEQHIDLETWHQYWKIVSQLTSWGHLWSSIVFGRKADEAGGRGRKRVRTEKEGKTKCRQPRRLRQRKSIAKQKSIPRGWRYKREEPQSWRVPKTNYRLTTK